MFPDDSDSGLNKYPQYEAKESFFRLSLLIPKVTERLLHRISNPLPEILRIEAQQFAVECKYGRLFLHRQRSESRKRQILSLFRQA
jgi:hypothetical protein